MIRLRLFGAPSLERDGVLLGGRAAQRHRLGLLALLALAPGRRLGRDRLIATLWPESDAERGRNLLKVSTYVLRSALGDEALLTAGDELRLSAELVEVDVAEFEAALARPDHARATELYEAPFMDGFFLSDAPEFEQWVERERGRLAGGYRKALEALAAAAGERGDFAAAAEWWRRRAVEDPYDSRVALRLMQSLEAGGNRAGAIQHAAIHQRLLQAELGVASAPEVSALADRLRREAPARATAPGRPAAPEPEKSEAEPANPRGGDGVTPASADAPRAPATSRRRRRAAGAVLLAVVAIAGAVWALRPRAAAAPRSIVVLPFTDLSAGGDQEYFSDGVTEEVITRLAAVPGLKVISRTSAMHYKGSAKPLPQIARELHVDHVLEGSVRHDGGRLRITAQLIDARDDGHLWAQSYDYDSSGGFRVQEEIARAVAEALDVRLGDRTRRLLARQGTRDPEAQRLYRRARYLWNTRTLEGHERALDYFRQAIERDSGFADAYAGIADVHLTAFQLDLFGTPESEAYSRLKWAAERALALDDESADAHVSSAVAHLFQRNWPGAEREFNRAIELNPGHAMARSWYSLLLRGMGRSDDALREARRAAELDPFAVVAVHNYAWQWYGAREYDRAVEQFRRNIDVAPYPGAFRGLGLTYAQMGRHDDAIRAVERAIELAPHRSDFLADLAYVEARAGRADSARAALERAKREPREGFNIARAHVALGEPDSAFAWLERSNWRWPHRANRGDPALDPIRSDPRFARLALRVEREMGLR